MNQKVTHKMKTITFKSTTENYRKEYLGLKPNTIRYFTIDEKNDIRKQILDDFIAGKINDICIEITNVSTHEYFIRRITDVSLFEEWYVISWKENF